METLHLRDNPQKIRSFRKIKTLYLRARTPKVQSLWKMENLCILADKRGVCAVAGGDFRADSNSQKKPIDRKRFRPVVSDEIETLISTFTRRGIKLIPAGDGLIVEPASKLTDADERTIRTWKPQLLQFLSRQSERNRWPERPRQALPLRRCGSLVCRTCHAQSPSPHRDGCAFPRFEPCRSRWFRLSAHGAKCVARASPADLSLVEAWVLAGETGEGEDGWRIPGEILALLHVATPAQ